MSSSESEEDNPKLRLLGQTFFELMHRKIPDSVAHRVIDRCSGNNAILKNKMINVYKLLDEPSYLDLRDHWENPWHSELIIRQHYGYNTLCYYKRNKDTEELKKK